MFQLVPDSSGQNHFAEQCWKDIDVADQQKIVDRAGIRDDQLHSSKSQALQGSDFPTQIFNGVIHPHLMGLQKTIQLIAGFKPQ